jgi:hypothetical protein
MVSCLIHHIGMFLWVRLVVEELRNCFSDWDLEEKANSLPKGLDEAYVLFYPSYEVQYRFITSYGRILERIMKGSSVAIRILEWIACSYRPLRAYEILDGIAFKPGCTSLNSRTKVHRGVLNLCRPLIEDGPSDTLEFVHFSAKRYETLQKPME